MSPIPKPNVPDDAAGPGPQGYGTMDMSAAILLCGAGARTCSVELAL